jgi:mannose-1-phosphate guanylyltransferase
VLFEYTRIAENMEFAEMIVSPRYRVDRNGDTTYVGDDRCALRWGDARG